jgi:hypothetical protein
MREYGPNPNGLRHLIRCSLLVLFAQGKHGTCEEVESVVEAEGYAPNTFQVQVAQVRRELLNDCGIAVDRPKGRLTKVQIADIEHQLGFKRVQERVAELRRAAEKVCRKAA